MDSADTHRMLDGIDIIINPAYNPPYDLTEVDNFFECRRMVSLSELDYDFKLEHEVLDQERIRLEKLEEKTEAIRKLKELKESTKQEVALKPIEEQCVTEPRLASPIVVSPVDPPVKPTPVINFSEFEDGASDPFETAELGTIDDLKELASVLDKQAYVRMVHAPPVINNSLKFSDLVEQAHTKADGLIQKTLVKDPYIAGSEHEDQNIPATSINVDYGRSEANPFLGMSDRQTVVCQIVSPMGFPPSRLKKYAEKIGENINQESLVNSCLLTTRLIDADIISDVPVIEDSVTVHNFDEKKILDHLGSIAKLAQMGFSSRSVHTALVDCHFDSKRAFENLLA